MYFHARGGLHPMLFFRKSQNLIKTIVTGHPNLRHLIGWSVSISYINISKWTHSSSHLYIIWLQWYHEPCYFSQTVVNAYMYIFWSLGYCVKCSNYLYYVLYQNSNLPTCPVHRMGTIAVINLRNWTFTLCAFLMHLQVFLGQWEQMVACCGPTTHYMWFLGGEKRFWPSSSCRLNFDLVKWQKLVCCVYNVVLKAGR